MFKHKFFISCRIVTGALLCIASCPDLALFATGSFCKTVLVFDSRAGCSPIARYQPHQRAVIRLAMSSNHILSASEDKTVSIWDQRAAKIMKTVTVIFLFLIPIISSL